MYGSEEEEDMHRRERRGRDPHDPRFGGRSGGDYDDYGHGGRFMRPASPVRPEYPAEPDAPTISKPSDEEWNKLQTEGWTIKWETIEKLFKDYQKQYVFNKVLTEKKGGGKINSKLLCC